MKKYIIDSINKIAKTDLNKLAISANPFLQYEFLAALETSGSVAEAKGWIPNHLVFKEEDFIAAILPCYIKQHSWGEYVFDWSWAEAYQQHGFQYYPKLVCTTPFTPVTSAKLYSQQINLADIFSELTDVCQQGGFNSWHILFAAEVVNLPADVYHRYSVQFIWRNNDYKNFADFLATFTARKRKNTNKERHSILAADISIAQITGDNITEQELDFFYLVYQLTYVKRGHSPHLTASFFKKIVRDLPNNILLIIARKNGKKIAASFFFYDNEHLYGRYWGCIEQIKNLHFECCYYQGIAFCINNKLKTFNPGTQGEHKIQRGFEPILTHSYHWIKQDEFKLAIRDFCQQERQQMLSYQQDCLKYLPFKQSPL